MHRKLYCPFVRLQYTRRAGLLLFKTRFSFRPYNCNLLGDITRSCIIICHILSFFKTNVSKRKKKWLKIRKATLFCQYVDPVFSKRIALWEFFSDQFRHNFISGLNGDTNCQLIIIIMSRIY